MQVEEVESAAEPKLLQEKLQVRFGLAQIIFEVAISLLRCSSSQTLEP